MRYPVYGARPLKKFIQREVETRIGRTIIAWVITDWSTVTFGVTDKELAVTHTAKPIILLREFDRNTPIISSKARVRLHPGVFFPGVGWNMGRIADDARNLRMKPCRFPQMAERFGFRARVR